MANCLILMKCSLAKEGVSQIGKAVVIRFTAGSDADAQKKATVIWQEESEKLKKEGRVIRQKSILFKQIPFP